MSTLTVNRLVDRIDDIMDDELFDGIAALAATSGLQESNDGKSSSSVKSWIMSDL